MKGRLFLTTILIVVALSVAAGLAAADNPGADSLVSGEEITIGDSDEVASDDIERQTITLVTGETLEVVESGDKRQITVASDHEPHAFANYEDEGGEYVVPHNADLDVFSEELFNIDLLLDVDAEDGTPVIIRSNDGVATASSVASVDGVDVGAELDIIDSVAGTIALGDDATAESLTSSAAIEQVYLDAPFETQLDISTQAVQAEAFREQYDVDGEGVDIAVLDTGVDADHPDFGDRVVDQVDFTGDGIGDVIGHGTHVAGIAAGDGNVGNESLVGVAPGANVMDVKVLGDAGTGNISTIVEGIEYALDEDADMLSMSLGGPPQAEDPLTMAVESATEQGTPAIVSAGNEGDYFGITSPANAEGAVAVGATQFSTQFDEERPAEWFSSAGPTDFDHLVKPEVVAPGTALLSDINATGSQDAGEFPYTEKAGTSMAAPHVSGAVALMKSAGVDLEPDELEDRLVSTADPLKDAFGDPDVFQKGGGAVRTVDAMEAELQIHDAVTSFGLYEEATTDTAIIPVENIGDESLEVETALELRNLESEQDISDQAELNQTTFTVEPGEIEHVELEVDTTDAVGLNSGLVDFVANDTEYNAPFGFLKGIEVVVEKELHENSSTAAGDHIQVWDEDGNIVDAGSEAFTAANEHRFLVFEPMNLTAWSGGNLDPTDEQEDIQGDDPVGDPVVTITEDERVDFDDNTITLYENETQPLELDTSEAQHQPLEVREIEQTAYAFPDEDTQLRRSFRFMGEGGIDTVHFSPFEEASDYEWSTEYHLYEDQGAGLDTPHAYHLYYEGDEMPADGSSVAVDHDELIQEDIEFHRSFDPQNKWLSAHIYPVNYDVLSSFAVVSDIGLDRTEQTWYRTPEIVEFSENWYSAEPGQNNWVTGDREFQHARTEDPDLSVGETIFEAGETYQSEIGAEPLFPYLNFWDYNEFDDELVFQMLWHADQADDKFHLYNGDRDNPFDNTFEFVLDGETIEEGSVSSFSTVEFEEVLGSTMEIHMESNRLLDTLHPSVAEASATVHFEEATANAPPQIEEFDVDRSAHNEMPAGEQTVTVTLADTGAGIDEFEAYYGPDTDGSPFADESEGWTEATVEHLEDTTYEVSVNTTGMRGALDLAVHAVDGDDNSFQAVANDTLRFSPPALPGFESPPQDLNRDGLFEDITGDGELTIFDVQALFDSLDATQVQNNPDWFDFAGTGDDRVSVFDIQALYTQLTAET